MRAASVNRVDVIATAGSGEGRDRLRDLGATAVLDYESESLAEEVLAATDGAGVETVLDTASKSISVSTSRSSPRAAR